jgi:uncharacterized membrane protein YjgN (DUF898 family)
MEDQGSSGRPDITAYPLEFTGTGGEYFRVWFVNVLLTILTLGLYTPLARRRTAQYFYGHTMVAESPLEFTAQGKRMVLGFVLFGALYIAYKVAADTHQDRAAGLMLLGATLLAPYLWGSAMRFRFNATRWRGVRLQFTATWPEVYFAGFPAIILGLVWVGAPEFIQVLLKTKSHGAHVTAGFVGLGALIVSLLCAMRIEYNAKSLMVAKGRIGGQAGRWKPEFGDFVRIWLATVGVFLAMVLVMGGVLFAAVGGPNALIQAGQDKKRMAVMIGLAVFATFFLLLIASAPARAYREARLFKLVWSNIGVSHMARFKCRLKPWRFVGLRVRNVVLTLLTFGFWRPFARVSEYRMKAESVTLHVKGGLDQLAGQLAREEAAVGDAIADAVGLELVG